MTQVGGRGVAIVGAGWAGLVAAHDLVTAGLPVHLFEMAPQAGGRARTATLRLAGRELLLDNGQHLLIGAYVRTLARLTRLGLPAGQGLARLPLQFESTALGLRRRGPGRAGLLTGMLLARGLGMADRLALARLGLVLARARWQGQQGRTLADLLHRTGQTEHLVRTFWRPFCLAAMNTLPEQACAQTFVNVLHDSLLGGADGSDFLVPRVPMGALLADPLLARLRRDGARVSLKTRSAAWTKPTANGGCRARASPCSKCWASLRRW
ncbi:MAG: NAD(P)-binding protein [Burkholderiaceae bacterium]